MRKTRETEIEKLHRQLAEENAEISKQAEAEAKNERELARLEAENKGAEQARRKTADKQAAMAQIEVQKQPAVAPPSPKVQAETRSVLQSIHERTGLLLHAGGTALEFLAATIEGAEFAGPIGIGVAFVGMIWQIWN